MPLQMRPTCELCATALPPNSTDARICSYECTFCSSCADSVLANVCPNCGGGFAPRPIRPQKEWRAGICVAKQPPSVESVHTAATKYTRDELAAFVDGVKGVKPEDR